MRGPVKERLFRAEDVFLHRAPTAADAQVPALSAGDDVGDPSACAEILAAAAGDPVLSEALELASPSLSAMTRRVAERGPGAVKPGQLRRAALAVLRYDIRMRTRPTPFGLFAGVACGRFDSAAKAERGTAHRTRTHVDMQWLTRVVHRLESDPAVLTTLPVQAHQALVTRGDRLVLTAPSTQGVRPGDSGEGRSAVSVRRTPVVERAVAESRSPLPFEELVRRTAAAFPQAPEDRVRGLLAELVRQELLITGLRPPLDGGDPLDHVLRLLDRVFAARAERFGEGGTRAAVPHEPAEETSRIRKALLAVDREREAYDDCPVGEGRDGLRNLLRAARSVEPDDTPVHIDTRLDTRLHLPYEVRDVVEDATAVMWRLSRVKRGLFALRDYHRRFLDVYGADRLVPVLELLDEATGLGPPAGYGWPNSEAAPVTPEDPRTTRRDRAMARMVAAAQRSGSREVVLDDTDLEELCHDGADRVDTADLPNSCEVTVQVAAPSVEALDEGDFRVFLSPSPGSHRAGSTFARFADLDPDWRSEFGALHRDVPVHVQEARPADLAFMPRSGRAANLAHTVPATGRRITVGLPDAPGTEELRLDDIGIGATLDRMTAVHLPTGREVIPVMGNMVSAPAQAPNPIRLLWEIGLEGQRLWEPWNWGPLADAPFVPRVRYGRFVLASAVWRLDELRAEAERLREADGQKPGGSRGARWDEAVRSWRTRWDAPLKVLAVTADQRLLLDLDLAWHRELLLDQVLRHSDLIAQEVPGEYEGWTDSPLAGHTFELVVPMVRAASAVAGRRPYAGHREPARTVHGLGGEWIYLKLYGSARTQDDVLRERIPELVGLAADKGADGWFFIRYTDESGHHLRLRLHGGEPNRLWGTVAPAVGELLQSWQSDGLLRGHSVGQYDPETERYGGAGAQRLAENVFQLDSEAAIALLRAAKDPANPYDLDDLAVVSCAALAHAFGPPSSPDPRAGDCGDDGAVAWLSMTGSRRDLPAAFRSRSARWRRLVDPYDGWPALSADAAAAQALEALRPRDEAVRRLAAHVRESGETPEGRVVGSLLHMICNRLFGGDSARELTVLGIARGAVQDNLNRRRHQS